MLAKVNPKPFARVLHEIQIHHRRQAQAVLHTEFGRLQEDIAKKLTNPQKQQIRIKRQRYLAFYPSRKGNAPLDMTRLYRIMDGRRGGGARPAVAAGIFYASMRQGIKRIGILAAGFVTTGNQFNAKLPPAVAAQVKLGHLKVTDSPTKYLVIISNPLQFARHFRLLPIIIQKALNTRAASMRRNLALIRAGTKKYQFR